MEDIYRRIPHRPPFLFIDKILEIDGNGAKAELEIKPNLSFLEGHYPEESNHAWCIALRISFFQTGAIFLADFLTNEPLVSDDVTPVLSRIRGCTL